MVLFQTLKQQLIIDILPTPKGGVLRQGLVNNRHNKINYDKDNNLTEIKDM